jgi:hypothetical protein
MEKPRLYTVRETIRALRIARAPEKYADRTMEASKWWDEHGEIGDPKLEKRVDRAWEHLMDVIYDDDSDEKGEESQ